MNGTNHVGTCSSLESHWSIAFVLTIQKMTDGNRDHWRKQRSEGKSEAFSLSQVGRAQTTSAFQNLWHLTGGSTLIQITEIVWAHLLGRKYCGCVLGVEGRRTIAKVKELGHLITAVSVRISWWMWTEDAVLRITTQNTDLEDTKWY